MSNYTVVYNLFLIRSILFVCLHRRSVEGSVLPGNFTHMQIISLYLVCHTLQLVISSVRSTLYEKTAPLFNVNTKIKLELLYSTLKTQVTTSCQVTKNTLYFLSLHIELNLYFISTDKTYILLQVKDTIWKEKQTNDGIFQTGIFREIQWTYKRNSDLFLVPWTIFTIYRKPKDSGYIYLQMHAWNNKVINSKTVSKLTSPINFFMHFNFQNINWTINCINSGDYDRQRKSSLRKQVIS